MKCLIDVDEVRFMGFSGVEKETESRGILWFISVGQHLNIHL